MIAHDGSTPSIAIKQDFIILLSFLYGGLYV